MASLVSKEADGMDGGQESLEAKSLRDTMNGDDTLFSISGKMQPLCHSLCLSLVLLLCSV